MIKVTIHDELLPAGVTSGDIIDAIEIVFQDDGKELRQMLDTFRRLNSYLIEEWIEKECFFSNDHLRRRFLCVPRPGRRAALCRWIYHWLPYSWLYAQVSVPSAGQTSERQNGLTAPPRPRAGVFFIAEPLKIRGINWLTF